MTDPIYACSLTDEELAARRREWKAFDQGALVRTEARPDGRVLVYRGGERTAQVLRSLIEAERRCCPFLDFSVDPRDDEVLVRIGFVPEARQTAVELGVLAPD